MLVGLYMYACHGADRRLMFEADVLGTARGPTKECLKRMKGLLFFSGGVNFSKMPMEI
jgi:hypothetical protein